MTTSRSYGLLVFIFLLGCIEPIKVELSPKAGSLVVDALIIDQEGESRVILSQSVGYTEFIRNPALLHVRDASVSLESTKGRYNFIETSPGTYIPSDNFSAMPNVRYKLTIELEDGRKFESRTEQIITNTGIANIDKKWTVKKRTNELNVELKEGGVSLLLQTNEITDDNKYYRWRFTGTYRIETRPDLANKPPPCSGIDINPQTGIDEGTGICTCCTCWVIEKESLLVSNPDFREGKLVNVPIAFVRNSRGRFQYKYHYQADQLSVSRQAFEFWQQVNNQRNQGDLFAQPVGNIPSNFEEVTTTNTAVVGFFSVSSLVTATGYITAEDIDERIDALPVLKGTCLDIEGSTNIKPPYWN